MKKMLVLVCAILVSVVMTGCVTRMPEGFFVSEYTIPSRRLSATRRPVFRCSLLLASFAQGDAIEAAKKRGTPLEDPSR